MSKEQRRQQWLQVSKELFELVRTSPRYLRADIMRRYEPVVQHAKRLAEMSDEEYEAYIADAAEKANELFA